MVVAWRRLKEKAVLVEPRTAEVRILSPVAVRVWELIEAWRSEDDLVAALEAEYDAPQATIRADVLELLAALEARGLVESRDAGSPAPDRHE